MSDYAAVLSAYAPDSGGFSGILAPLLNALEWQGDARELAGALPMRKGPLTYTAFRNVLAELGYELVPLNVRPSTLHLHQGPCLLREKSRDGEKIRLIIAADETHMESIACGNLARERLPRSEAKGKVLAIRPLKMHEHTAGSWTRGLILRCRGAFLHVFALSLIVNAVALAVPFYVMMVYTKVVDAYSTNALFNLTAGVGLALLFEGWFRLQRAALLAWLTARLNMIVGEAAIARLLAMPAWLGERIPVSIQLARLHSIDGLRDLAASPVLATILELPFLLVLTIALGVIGGWLMLIPFALALAVGMLLFALRPSLALASVRAAHAQSDTQQLANEIFSSSLAIHQAGLNEAMEKRFDKAALHESEVTLHQRLLLALIDTVIQCFSMLSALAIIVAGVHEIWAGRMTPGELVGAMILCWRILMPLQQGLSLIPRLKHVRGGVEQIDRLMSQPAEENRPANTIHPPFAGSVSLVHLAVRYGRQADPVFSGLSVDIKAGELVAITGGNGSGKSSILKLLLGLYPAAAGSIRIDGTDIRQMTPASLRNRVSYLSQMPELFTGTLRENLKLHSPLSTDMDIHEALHRAAAQVDVQRLRAGLDTQIGEGGENISSMLAFRLNLARFYLNPQSLILCDELPFGLLSGETGANFHAFLRECKGRRTAIFVTHRDDYLKLADRVILLRADARPVVATASEIITERSKAA